VSLNRMAIMSTCGKSELSCVEGIASALFGALDFAVRWKRAPIKCPLFPAGTVTIDPKQLYRFPESGCLASELKGAALLRRPATEGSDLERQVRFCA
jgi:hypothetical protein